MISDKIYFNHIPKTGGTFLSETIENSSKLKVYFVDDSSEINLKRLSYCDLLTGHLGIDPNVIIKNIKTFTLIRHPVDRLISHYSNFVEEHRNSKKKLYDFNNWLFDDDKDFFIKTNFQSKCLTNPREFPYLELKDLEAPRNNYFKKGFGIKNVETNFENAFQYLQNCELVLINEKIIDQALDIANLLNIDFKSFYKTINIKNPKLINKNSQSIREQINTEQYNKIIKLNDIDMEIYNYFYFKF
jgi:hypothetical protein